ncbi:MAG: hypothetical protein ACI9HK_001617 [Pirellulaceae bacterium]|jgi:hypothetical protein
MHFATITGIATHTAFLENLVRAASYCDAITCSAKSACPHLTGRERNFPSEM